VVYSTLISSLLIPSILYYRFGWVLRTCVHNILYKCAIYLKSIWNYLYIIYIHYVSLLNILSIDNERALFFTKAPESFEVLLEDNIEDIILTHLYEYHSNKLVYEFTTWFL